MRIIKVDTKNPSPKAIRAATEVIKKGGVIIYPTDTIYGIGASALDQKAIDKVYRIKSRPGTKPLSVIVSDIKMAKKYVRLGKMQEEIFSALLPGAFTLILPFRAYKSNKILTVSDKTLSIRIPDSKITSMLSKELRIPFTATSANLSGLPGSGNVNEVLNQLKNKEGEIDLVLDAGILPKKNPSKIIDLTGDEPEIIRK